jgi:hypothetical protein
LLLDLKWRGLLGVHAIVAQGYEAGGHRGVFDPDADDDRLGTMALTRLLLREFDVPVIADGPDSIAELCVRQQNDDAGDTPIDMRLLRHVAGNGVLEGWKPAVQFEDGPVHSCGNTFANATEWLADIQHAAMRDEVADVFQQDKFLPVGLAFYGRHLEQTRHYSC